MFLLRKKKKEEQAVPTQSRENELICDCAYDATLGIIISKGDCMIVRVSIHVSKEQEAPKGGNVVIKDEAGNQLSFRSEFIGERPLSTNGENKELIYALFVPYPEKNFIVEIQNDKTKKPLHQQFFDKKQVEEARAAEDQVLYRFAENDPWYPECFLKKYRATLPDLVQQKNARFNIEPKFSIVVPLYRTPIEFLKELIESIKTQTYNNWELLLVRAKDESDELASTVKEATQEDERIREVLIEKNEGISKNTANGIAKATGDFVCFVDHDDIIEPNCLFEYAYRINEKPDTDMLYCDEDLLKPNGRFEAPAFKPGFSEFFLRSNNYVCHMLTIRKSLLLELEYNNSDYDGAQDHHLTLQACEKTSNIEHVEKVLYHWRICETSTAGNDGCDKKPYATNAGIRAVSRHLERRGIKGTVQPHHTFNFHTHVNYDIPDPKPYVSVICLLDESCASSANELVASILQTSTYNNFEIIIGSSANLDIQNSKVKTVHLDSSLNKAAKLNELKNNAKGEILIFATDCTQILTPTWIEELVGLIIQNNVGASTCKVLYSDETVKHAGVFLGDHPYSLFKNLPNRALSNHGYLELTKDVSALSVDCLCIKATTFDELNGFDEKAPSFCDVDLSLKIRSLNKHIIYTPAAAIFSLETSQSNFSWSSTLKSLANTEWSYMIDKWGGSLTSDPHASPYVSKDWRGGYIFSRL